MTVSTDSVTVTTVVQVIPSVAFEVFTEEVDGWWKHGPRFRTGERGKSKMRFEAGVGGRLIEVFDEAADPFELGRITAWEPAKHLVFEMGGRDFRAGEKTEVEVRFEEVEGGTRVTVEHRGWDAFAVDHPVRHGFTGGAFTSMIGVFWQDLLGSQRRWVQNRKDGKDGKD